MKKLCIICAAACLLLSGCGRNNESAAPSAASGQSSALSAAENQSTANQTAESDRSKTAAFCELLEKRCFTAQTESYSKGELYSRQTIEWNGSDLHIVTEAVPNSSIRGRSSEQYIIGGKTYSLRDGKWTVISERARTESAASLFFNAGKSPADMTLLRTEKTADGVKEYFAKPAAHADEMWVSFADGAAYPTASGYADDETRLIRFSEEAPEIRLPE